jgi:tRNA uridine 5-carbamoylmethylation protein Kti12
VIDLLAAYEARIRIVYVEASRGVYFERNRGRSHPVREDAIERMMDRWEVPDPTEAQQVDWLAW